MSNILEKFGINIPQSLQTKCLEDRQFFDEISNTTTKIEVAKNLIIENNFYQYGMYAFREAAENTENELIKKEEELETTKEELKVSTSKVQYLEKELDKNGIFDQKAYEQFNNKIKTDIVLREDKPTKARERLRKKLNKIVLEIEKRYK